MVSHAGRYTNTMGRWVLEWGERGGRVGFAPAAAKEAKEEAMISRASIDLIHTTIHVGVGVRVRLSLIHLLLFHSKLGYGCGCGLHCPSSNSFESTPAPFQRVIYDKVCCVSSPYRPFSPPPIPLCSIVLKHHLRCTRRRVTSSTHT